jgi:ABC-type siderophore export system fused ATPase/permease subunit
VKEQCVVSVQRGVIMKLRQQQVSKIDQLFDALEEKVEQMEQQDYMSFDLGKDLQAISFMLDKLKEEIEKK